MESTKHSDSVALSCPAQIEERYSQLQGSVRRVADTLLRAPGNWVGKSISQLARESGVSEATVVRFVRSVGYSGYRAFALALARSGAAAEPGLDKMAGEEAGSGNLVKIVRNVFEEEARALTQAPKTINSELLEEAVNVLCTARQVYCYAVASSSLLAGAAEYRFVRLGINCIPIRDPIQMAIQTSLFSSKDVVLAFSQTGRNRDAVDGLLLAREAGATTIGVTSEPGSPLAKASDIPLVLFKANPQGCLLDVKIAELILIDALVSCIPRRRKTAHGEAEADRVDKQIEAMLIRPRLRRNARQTSKQTENPEAESPELRDANEHPQD